MLKNVGKVKFKGFILSVYNATVIIFKIFSSDLLNNNDRNQSVTCFRTMPPKFVV